MLYFLKAQISASEKMQYLNLSIVKDFILTTKIQYFRFTRQKVTKNYIKMHLYMKFFILKLTILPTECFT